MKADLKKSKINQYKTALLVVGILIALFVTVSTDLFSNKNALAPVKTDSINNASCAPAKTGLDEKAISREIAMRPLSGIIKIVSRHFPSSN